MPPRRNLTNAERGRLEALASVGTNIETIAKRLGLARRTLDAILDRDAEALAALQTGRGQLESDLVGSLYRQATRKRSPVPASAMFLLKSMCGYSDQPRPRDDGPRLNVVFQLPRALTTEQYQALVKLAPPAALLPAGETTDED